MFLRDERHERRAGRRGRVTTIDIASRGDVSRAPGTAAPERAVVPARQLGAASHQRRTLWLGVGLVAVARVLGSRRFFQLLAVGGIVLVALAQMGWKLLARTVRDLIAWDNARLAELENQENQLRRQRTAQAPDGAVLEGIVVPARQPGAADRRRRAVVLGVGLVAGARVLRNRRLDEQVIVFVLALAALAQMSRKELARAVMDLIAWDNARLADLQRQLRRQRKARADQPAAS